MVFQILVTWLFSRNENLFFGRHFEIEHFLMFFLLIYGYPMCMQTWCKFRTEIFSGKYFLEGVLMDPLMHKREWKVALVGTFSVNTNQKLSSVDSSISIQTKSYIFSR